MFLRICVRKFYKPSFLTLWMVGIVAVIVKLMPKNPDVDVAGLQGKARKVLEKKGAKNISFEINELAFGLKALMIKFAWLEEKGSSVYEDALGKIEGVSSASTEDYRRAFG